VSEVIRRKDEFLSQMDELKKQYHTNSPYLLGQIAGQIALAKGAAKTVAKVPVVVDAAKTATNSFAKEMTGIRPSTAAKAVADTIEANKDAADKAAEANTKATAEHLEKTQSALHETEGKELTHKEKLKQVEDENQAKREAHAKLVEETNAHNREVAEATRTANELKQRIVPKAEPSRFKVIQDAAKQYFDMKYNRLSKLIGERKAPLDELAEGVDVAEGKLEGSDTKVQVFEDIKKRAKGEISASEHLPDSWHEMSPDEQREFLAQRSAQGNKISFDDLRGYYRELGKVIGSDSTAPDVKQAAIAVREVLDKMQKDLAEQSGLKAKRIYNEVSKEYKNYAQTMLDRTGPKASATAKALSEPDADNALKHFEGLPDSERSRELGLLAGRDSVHADWLRGVEGETPGKLEQLTTPVEERAEAGDTSARIGKGDQLRNMRNYRLNTEKLVRQYLDAAAKRKGLGGYRGLPDHPDMAEPPEPPVRTAPPDRPPEITPKVKQLGEEDITEANREEYRKTLEALKRRGIWYGAALPWLWVARSLMDLKFGTAAEQALGAAATSVGTVIGLTKLTEYLNKPAIREWIIKPSTAELAELDKLPEGQRKIIADGLKNVRVVAAKEGIKVSPKLVEYSKRNG
jgi:hypothetical protein